jgi:DNA repair protein RecO (recombination protein O)
MEILKARGIVIKKTNAKEADLILKVFTKEYGKIDIYINGIRKSKRREKLAVELMSVTDFLIYEKNSKYASNSFTLAAFFPKIQLSFLKLKYSYYLLHLIDKIYENNSEDTEFYNKIISSFEYINVLDEDEKKNEILLAYLTLYLLKDIILTQGIYEHENILNLAEEDNREKLGNILENPAKKIINSRLYTVDEVSKMIISLEKYINYNLNRDLKYKFFV